MKKGYINGLGCVSAQNTTDYITFLESCNELTKNIVHVQKPSYKDFIKPTMIRRMANGVKNGIVAASMALKDANVAMPNAIITGTGLGCVIDSDKFLKKCIDNDEQFLTPTSFIQSTHNTVGGQIALGLQCKAYNVTYVHSAISLESSLLDALLLINDNEETILVGGIDELGDYTTNLFQLIGHIKDANSLENGILNSHTVGAIFSEGAQFFYISNKKNDNTYVELIDVAIHDVLKIEEVATELLQFLATNNLKIEDIDLVVLGNNGDTHYDNYYTNLQQTILEKTQQIYYKHLSGEYNTASGFGLWIASQVCKNQTIPNILKLNNKKEGRIKNVLLYNQYRGESHSFTLIRSC